MKNSVHEKGTTYRRAHQLFYEHLGSGKQYHAVMAMVIIGCIYAPS
jgi:hypothetical protein